MSKHIVKGYVTFKPAEYDWEKDKVGFVDFKPHGNSSWGHIVGEHSIEVEIPDDFDPRVQQIKDLEEQRQRLHTEFARRVKELDDKLAKLQAIEFSGSEA